MDASISKAKGNCLDSVETLRDRWMQRDSEIIQALRKLQDSVEARLRDLETGSDGRFAGIRLELDEKLAAAAAAALDHQEKTELQIAEAKRQLAKELAESGVSTLTNLCVVYPCTMSTDSRCCCLHRMNLAGQSKRALMQYVPQC